MSPVGLAQAVPHVIHQPSDFTMKKLWMDNNDYITILNHYDTILTIKKPSLTRKLMDINGHHYGFTVNYGQLLSLAASLDFSSEIPIHCSDAVLEGLGTDTYQDTYDHFA